MRRIRIIAAALAVAVALAPLTVQATQKKDNNEEDRDGQSRYELAPLNYLPLAFVGAAQERIVTMYILMQQVSYFIQMTTGVEVTSQNRVGLGGIFGGVFAPTFSAEDFVRSLEVGTVYRAGNGHLAVALAGDEVLTDHRVIVFNGDYQYDPKALPTLQQVPPENLQKLQAYSLMTELAYHSLTTPLMNVIANLDRISAGELNGTAGLTPAQRETEIPALRQLIVGKVYRGANNTLLVVIPPAIVLDR